MHQLKVAFAVLALAAGCITGTTRVVTANDPSNPDAVIAPVVPDAGLIEPSAAALFSCPMHPEVQGAQGASCFKCGMRLSVPVP